MEFITKLGKSGVINDLEFYIIENFFLESNNKDSLIKNYYEICNYFIDNKMIKYLNILITQIDSFLESTQIIEKKLLLHYLNLKYFHINNRFDKSLTTIYHIEKYLDDSKEITLKIYSTIAETLYDNNFYNESKVYQDKVMNSKIFNEMSISFQKEALKFRMALLAKNGEVFIDYYSDNEDIKHYVKVINNIYGRFYEAIYLNDKEKLEIASKNYIEYNKSVDKYSSLTNSVRLNMIVLDYYFKIKEYDFVVEKIREFLKKDYVSNYNIIKVKDLYIKTLKKINRHEYIKESINYNEFLHTMIIKHKNVMSDHIKQISQLNLVSQMLDKMKKDLEIDSLTKCGTRISFEKISNKFFIDNGAVIYYDLNGLKLINDYYGHSVGDEYLRKFGDIINRFQSDDFISFRLGGDEFVSLVRNTTRKEIKEVLEIIKERCRNAIKVNLLSISIDYSVGVSYVSRENKNITELLMQADVEMYKDKRNKKKRG